MKIAIFILVGAEVFNSVFQVFLIYKVRFVHIIKSLFVEFMMQPLKRWDIIWWSLTHKPGDTHTHIQHTKPTAKLVLSANWFNRHLYSMKYHTWYVFGKKISHLRKGTSFVCSVCMYFNNETVIQWFLEDKIRFYHNINVAFQNRNPPVDGMSERVQLLKDEKNSLPIVTWELWVQ